MMHWSGKLVCFFPPHLYYQMHNPRGKMNAEIESQQNKGSQKPGRNVLMAASFTAGHYFQLQLSASFN